MSLIHIVKQGITDLDVDCVVNAANEGLWAGGGVCGAIFKEAGYDKLERACKEIGHCDTGSAVITPGFNLKAKYIIHAVGPRWQGGTNNEEELLRKCYQKAMSLAQDNGCKTIGFPVISSGIFGYPKKEAWEVALCAVDSCRSDLEVYFAVLDDAMLELGNQVYESLTGNSEEAILAAVDRDKLWDCIETLCKIRKVEWTPSEVVGKTEAGKDIITLLHPVYPEEIIEIFHLLESDDHYLERKKDWPKGLLPTEMSASQVKTMLTWIFRRERFGDGIIAKVVKDGTLLKLLLRLDDLLEKGDQ